MPSSKTSSSLSAFGLCSKWMDFGRPGFCLLFEYPAVLALREEGLGDDVADRGAREAEAGMGAVLEVALTLKSGLN